MYCTTASESTTSHDINPEWKLVAIGRGSFATVSILSGRPVAFKHIICSGRTPELKAEFEAIRCIYDSCDTDSFFAIPRPLAYYDPAVSTSFCSPDSPPISKVWSRARRPLVAEDDFKALKLDSAAYAMDQVLPLPLSTALLIRRLFYPPGQDMATVPSLCRLYFGKVIDMTSAGGRPSRFFNSSNFPLDVTRYSRILEAARMLGHLHCRGGYDGRDVEFVMGGASFSGIAMNIIDFNQMRPWMRKKNEIHQLKFCLEAAKLAEVFLRAIEAEQAKRDSAVRISFNCDE
ncbi:hypothetical protein BJV77DRAFT_974108 [Russula vinacea]|nr:hypothetical protein BJV77DRAFT_974108 [Russula vinacea]